MQTSPICDSGKEDHLRISNKINLHGLLALIVELKSVIQNAADAEGFPVRFIPIKNALDLYGDETEDVCPPLFIGNPPVSRWNSEERANDITSYLISV